MRAQPRQQILDLWQAASRSSLQDGKWVWGGRIAPNSISDAEQLSCFMYPAAAIPGFRLDLPDQTAEDVVAALKEWGDAVAIPRLLVKAMTEYLRNYTDEEGAPIFSGGSYFVADGEGPDGGPSEEQLKLDVVDSYSMSVSLMLYAIGFVKTFRTAVRREELRRALNELEALASTRLSAAMVGLLRSFTVNVFAPDSAPGSVLVRTINQHGAPSRVIVDDLQKRLNEVRASIRDFISIGSGQTTELDNPNLLFEVGWSWGLVKDAPEIQTIEKIGPQRKGVAPETPFLYFTVNALDGIADLFSERTVVLGLLNEEQQRLSQALRLRWQLTQSYWSIISRFGEDRWPLEDIPWRTTDEEESDYYSLLIASIVVQDLQRRGRGSDLDLRRISRVLEELGERGRVIRRAVLEDRALGFHSPGVVMNLIGSEELGPNRLRWVVPDYATLLLKRTIRVADQVRSNEQRDFLVALVDKIWEHLDSRRLSTGVARGLWDQPANHYEALTEYHEQVSWYYTERIVECLVGAADLVTGSPPRSVRLADYALDLLNEAEHLFNAELLGGSAGAGMALRETLQRMQTDLVRAREVLTDRPGTSAELVGHVLRELDRLNVARRDAGRPM